MPVGDYTCLIITVENRAKEVRKAMRVEKAAA
jgi:hypothetical protein